MLTIALFIIGAVSPPWLTSTFGYLAVRSVSSLFNVQPILTIGYADLYVADVFFLGVVCRLLVDLSLGRADILRSDFKRLPGLWAFLIVMFIATLLSYLWFDPDYFSQQIVSLIRLLVVPFGVLFLVLFYKLDFVATKHALVATRWVGYLAAGSIYAGMLFGIGEINLVETGVSAYRYQGVLGDSVKLFLLPFIFWEILRGKYIGAGFLTAALLLTGGRFGLIGLMAGLIYILFFRRKIKTFTKHRTSYLGVAALVLLGLLSLGFIQNWGGMRTRFLKPTILEYGVGRRVETWKLGLLMGKDFWLTGAGYNAYRLLFPEYCGQGPVDVMFPVFSTETFSQVIKSLVDGGVFGVVTFAWMMFNFLNIVHTRVEQGDRELKAFLSAGYVTVITFMLLSPFVVWLNPGSKVGYAFMLFMALAIKLRGLQRKWNLYHEPREVDAHE